MKTLFWMILGIIVVLAAGWEVYALIWTRSGTGEPLGQLYQNNQNLFSSNGSNTSYQNAAYNFGFEYPIDFTVFKGPDTIFPLTAFLKASSTEAVTATIPDTSYPGTNFLRAYMTVSESPAASDNDCRQFARSGDEKLLSAVEEKDINGLKFWRRTLTASATGATIESHIYHVFSKGKCFEISQNVFTRNLETYKPGAIVPIDKDKIWKKLETVLLTFKFS